MLIFLLPRSVNSKTKGIAAVFLFSQVILKVLPIMLAFKRDLNLTCKRRDKLILAFQFFKVVLKCAKFLSNGVKMTIFFFIKSQKSPRRRP